MAKPTRRIAASGTASQVPPSSDIQQETRARALRQPATAEISSNRDVESNASSQPERLAACHQVLATHVDQFIQHSSFVPLKVPASHLKRPGKPDHRQPNQQGALKAAILGARAAEINEKLKLIPFEEYKKQTKIDVEVKSPIASAALKSAILDPTRQAAILQEHYDRHLDDARRSLEEKERDDGVSVFLAPSYGEALRRLGRRVLAEHKLFAKSNGRRGNGVKETDEPLANVQSLGFLFLERLRIRPLGHTPERAPFYLLSLTPGESVTVRQQSFSKRSATFEETLEEEETKKLEYSSTFTTELAEQYSQTVQEGSNWGISQSVTGGFGNGVWNISGTTAGNYGASSSQTDSVSQISKNVEQTARKVESSHKVAHKTTVTISTEDTLQQESLRVFRNDEARIKKVYMRRLMQVLHLSYERYGVRLCWAPCIQDPGRDVRQLMPTTEGFPEQIEAIRVKWQTATPPPEAAISPPGSKEFCAEWTGKLGTTFGDSYNTTHHITIGDGYEYSSARLEKKQIDGSPNVYILSTPSSGSTGTVGVKVHVGLSSGENINYRVCIVASPGAELTGPYEAALNAWRNQQAELEIQAFLEEKRKELAGIDPNAWPPSELARRIVKDYFGSDVGGATCDLVQLLHRVFEWENISATIYPPWWDGARPIDGLQSLRTTFLNASWAKVYLPLRPTLEEEGVSYLLSIGAIPTNPQWLADLEFYLDGMRNDLEPQFTRAYQASATDTNEISSPRDIILTSAGAPSWTHAYESDEGFTVLNRFIATIPTDGVDFEEKYAQCPLRSTHADALERELLADANISDAVATRLGTGDGSIQVQVNEAS